MSQFVQAKARRGLMQAPVARPPQVAVLRTVGGIKLHHTLEEDFSVYAPASFVERFFATCIDSFVLGVVVTLLKLPFLKILGRLEMLEELGKIQAINGFLLILAFLVYQIAPQILWGQTLGKSFFGIRVVTLENSSKVRPSQIAKREIIGKFVSAIILGFGFTMMLGRSDRRTLHDLMCETKVVKFKR